MSVRILAGASGVSRFLRDRSGTTVLETMVVFLPIMALFLANIEIILAFYAINAAEKSAQNAARFAASQSPVYIGSDFYDATFQTVRRNVPKDTAALDGRSCYQLTGYAENSACVIPDDSNWVCSGLTYESEAHCDEGRFEMLLDEVQRFYPAARAEDVTVQYIYRPLGRACGRMIPEIQVTIAPKSLPTDFLGFSIFASWGTFGRQTADEASPVLGYAIASALGEDMRSSGIPRDTRPLDCVGLTPPAPPSGGAP